MNAKELEKIYNDTISEFKRIARFHSLTTMTYKLALTSVKENADMKGTLKLPENLTKEKISYSMADIIVLGYGDESIESLELDLSDIVSVSGFMMLDDYSEEIGRSLDNVKIENDGKVQENGGKSDVFWLPEEQAGEELPPVYSKNKYVIKGGLIANSVLDIESSLEEMITFLGTEEKLKKRTSAAELLLNRETFLLYWSTFELYVKNISYALFDLFPEQVFTKKKYGKNQMSYLDIFEKSSRFISIKELKEAIINSIIGDTGTSREAISKQIIFIQDCYLEKGQNPYDTWYVLNGETKTINYQVLDQIRLIRNALVHNTGEMKEEWEKIDLISRPDDNRIVVDEDLLLKTMLILESLVCNLYFLIINS